MKESLWNIKEGLPYHHRITPPFFFYWNQKLFKLACKINIWRARP